MAGDGDHIVLGEIFGLGHVAGHSRRRRCISWLRRCGGRSGGRWCASGEGHLGAYGVGRGTDTVANHDEARGGCIAAALDYVHDVVDACRAVSADLCCVLAVVAEFAVGGTGGREDEALHHGERRSRFVPVAGDGDHIVLGEVFGLGHIAGFAVVRYAVVGERWSRNQAQESDEHRREHEQSADHV